MAGNIIYSEYPLSQEARSAVLGGAQIVWADRFLLVLRCGMQHCETPGFSFGEFNTGFMNAHPELNDRYGNVDADDYGRIAKEHMDYLVSRCAERPGTTFVIIVPATVNNESSSVIYDGDEIVPYDPNFKDKEPLDLGSFMELDLDANEIKKRIKDMHMMAAMPPSDAKTKSMGFVDPKTNKIIGTVCVYDRNDGLKGIRCLEVAPTHRGHGLATQIMDMVVNKYGGQRLNVVRENRVAKELYAKHGFEITDHFKNHDQMTLKGPLKCPRCGKTMEKRWSAGDMVWMCPDPKCFDDIFDESCKDLNAARQFCSDVKNLAKKYDASFFVVTDGASAIHNSGNPAVKAARDAHIAWERANGGDPDEDWSASMKKVKNEAVAEFQPLRRETKTDIAERYGLRDVGNTHDANPESKKPSAQQPDRLAKKLEAERRAKAIHEKRMKNLRKANRVKRRKRFVRKIKSLFKPSSKNEGAVADVRDARWIDSETLETDNLWGDQKRVFDGPDHLHDHDGTETAILEAPMHIKFSTDNENRSVDNALYPVYIIVMNQGTSNEKVAMSFDVGLNPMYVLRILGATGNVAPRVLIRKETPSDYAKRRASYAIQMVVVSETDRNTLRKHFDLYARDRIALQCTVEPKNILGSLECTIAHDAPSANLQSKTLICEGDDISKHDGKSLENDIAARLKIEMLRCEVTADDRIDESVNPWYDRCEMYLKSLNE